MADVENQEGGKNYGDNDDDGDIVPEETKTAEDSKTTIENLQSKFQIDPRIIKYVLQPLGNAAIKLDALAAKHIFEPLGYTISKSHNKAIYMRTAIFFSCLILLILILITEGESYEYKPTVNSADFTRDVIDERIMQHYQAILQMQQQVSANTPSVPKPPESKPLFSPISNDAMPFNSPLQNTQLNERNIDTSAASPQVISEPSPTPLKQTPPTVKTTPSTTTTTTTTRATPTPSPSKSPSTTPKPTPIPTPALPSTKPSVPPTPSPAPSPPVKKLPDCVPRKFSDKPLTPTALVSFPRSGNTWVRHLIEQMSGTYTASVFCDKGLEARGFVGECAQNTSVIAIKTHLPHSEFHPFKKEFTQAIVIMREPMDAIKSWYTIQHAGKPMSGTEWNSFVDVRSKVWKHLMLDWTKEFVDPILILRYENLVKNLEPELKKIKDFLKLEVSEERMKCVLSNSGEIYKRRHSDTFAVDPYTKEQRYSIEELKGDIDTAISRRNTYGLQTYV